MPLLDLPEDNGLARRFNFLNVSTGDESAPSARKQATDDTLSSFLAPAPARTSVHPPVVNATDLSALFVVKTAIRSGKKVFINITTLATDDRSLRLPADHILLGEPFMDTDKVGNECHVITALLQTPTFPEDDRTIKQVIRAVGGTLQADLSEKYNVPKMRKKARLTNIIVQPAPTQGHASISEDTNQKRVQSLITDVTQASDQLKHTYEVNPQSLGAKRKHEISTLSPALLAMPLPTLYTNHISVVLEQTTTRKQQSWSCYYDSQDSTLKILVPPDEEFITIRVRKDDFRAFSKGDQLHIFYVGA